MCSARVRSVERSSTEGHDGGGGKTDGTLGKFLIKKLQFGRYVKGVVFRRELPQLEALIARAKEMYEPHGAEYKESSKTFKFPDGAFLKCRFLDNDSDSERYQGHDYSDLMWEELGNFPSPRPIMKLKATLRSARGIPCQMYGTGNPGGPGQAWVKSRYIDPAPMGYHPIKEVERVHLPNGQIVDAESTRIYIPSRVTDNQILLKNDPNYISNLTQSGSEQLVKAWLHGDFNVIDGAFFDNFDERKHVIPYTDQLPAWWLRFRCADWGSYRPFAVYWCAVASDDWQHPVTGVLIPKGAIVVYREYYGVKTKMDGTIETNIGLKKTAEEVAFGILERDGRDSISYGVLDPSAFARDGGPSIAERMYTCTNGKVAFRRADNSRTGVRGPMGGWDQLRARLDGDASGIGVDRRPMVYFFHTCHHLIRTLPMMQHDPDKPEDIDTNAEDHAADALRYGCLSRPYTKPAPTQRRPMRGLSDMTLEDLWYHQDKIAQSDGRI